MSHSVLKWSVLGAAACCLLLVPTAGLAQISGDLVEPDVMLLVDSSAGMDLLRETGHRPDGMLEFEWSERVCREEAASTDSLTGWQKLQEAMLGSSSGNSRCTVEPKLLRPSLYGLERAEWGPLLTIGATGFPDNLYEFRNARHNHFRRVSCSADYWHYNTSANMYQCIKFPGDPGYVANSSDPGYVENVDGPTTTVNFPTINSKYPVQAYCRQDDADNINGLCWNYHPAAEPRLPNGVLDRYDGLARFGIMTVDGSARCATGTLAAPCDPRLTEWDYGDSRVLAGQTIGYFNAGARGDNEGAIGGLVRLGDDSNERTRSVLLTMEPKGCSEVGGMLDDAGYYFVTDPGALPTSFTISKKDPRLPAATSGTDNYYRCRPKIALLVTDGDFADFEQTGGECTINNTDADWDPLSPTADISAKTFDCPFRSAPEEAWELYDVGQRLLSQHVTSLGEVMSDSDEPIYLVVVGFNVPDSCKDLDVDPTCNPLDAACQKRRARCVDCTCDPSSFVDPADQAACELKRTKCLPYTSGFNDKRCFVDACPVGSTCLMTPREYLNEVACQGWPWDPPAAGGVGGHVANVPPPWLDPSLPVADRICEDPSPANPHPICTLTRGNTDNDQGDRALFVHQSSDLAKALDLILGSLSSTVATRTDVVTWNVPYESSSQFTGVTEVSDQYEFNSGYVAQPGKPWRGALKRTAYTCSGGGDVAQPANVANVGEQLDSQMTRRIYTPKKRSQTNSEFAVADPTTNPADWVNGAGNLQEVVLLSDHALNDCDFTEGSVAGLCNTDTDTDADHPIQEVVVDYTENRGLADIYNSTPAVLGPPAEELPIPSYEGYRAENATRHPFLFVSTNDGLLHAFDVTAMKEGANPVGDVEAFAFVPRAVLSQLWLQYPISVSVSGGTYSVSQGTDAGLYQHMFLGDGSPLAVDALLVQDPENALSDSTSDYWRAVVLSGLGKGARGYYALDVTDAMSGVAGPSNTRFLRWEIAPDAGLWGNNDATGQAQLSKMGRSVSRPALAYVYYSPTGNASDSRQYAAAILPGGYNPNSDPASNTGVYIVRLGDGKLIRYLEPNIKNTGDMCEGTPGLKESGGAIVESVQLLGEPSVPFGARHATVSRSAFIGDDRGRLWKIHMDSSDPDDWCLELYFDTLLAWDYPYQDCEDPTCTPDASCHNIDCCTGSALDKPCAGDPEAPRNMNAPRYTLLGAPTIAQNRDGKNVLVFGVGSMDSLATWSRSRIFSITEGGDSEIVDADTDDTDPGSLVYSPAVNWWIGDDIPSVDPPDGDSDFLVWQASMRTKMSGKQVDYNDYSGDNGDFFNVGEKLIGRPVVFNEVAYFTTFLPVSDPTTDDACNSGGSRIWGVDYENREGEDGVVGTSFSNDDFGKMGDATSTAPFVETPYRGALLSGVKVVARPRCSPDLDYDVYELTAQKANPSYRQGTSRTVSATAIASVTQKLGTKATPMSRFVRFDSWSIVFE